jgi:putative transposase
VPRLPRLHVEGGCYHVALRGNHRESIFSTSEDRLALNCFVAEAIEKYESRIHAFCWMTNHLHALIQIGQHPLGLIVKRFAMRYSRYRHRNLRTTGHLFEQRHRAWLVDADTYFIALLRYIHRNPVEARMVSAADEYPWSSHRAYLGIETMPWLTTEFGLGLFGKTIDAARCKYKAIVDDMSVTEATAPGLLASEDPRIIGTDRFLAALPPPRIKPRSMLSLSELAMQIGTAHGLSLELLKSASKQRAFSRARSELARRALDERVASLSDVARFLGRSPTTISRLAARRER